MEKPIQLKMIIEIILKYYPETQVVYLFGSAAEGNLQQHSDIDLALLLPHDLAKKQASLAMSLAHLELENHLKRDVDLVNLRQVSTVFQYVIINKGKVIYCVDEYSRKTFEMLTWSFYQKLNEERAEILDEFFRTGKAYAV